LIKIRFLIRKCPVIAGYSKTRQEMIPIPDNDKTACIILSGGLSSRMNTHKALLRFSERQNFLEHIIEIYHQAGVKKIIVVKNVNIKLSDRWADNNMVSIVENHFPEMGRLYSLQLGTMAMDSAAYSFIQNIDNPFVTTHLLAQLLEVRKKADHISPEYKGKGGHPVLISPVVVSKIRGMKEYDNTLRDLLRPYCRYKLITDDEHCIVNINDQEAYETHIKMKREMHTEP